MPLQKLPRLPSGNAVLDGDTWNNQIAPAIERGRINSISGAHMESGPNGQDVVIRVNPFVPQFVKLLGSTANGSNRWKYSFSEVHPVSTATNPANWVTKPGGITDATYGKALNGFEAFNTSMGVQGCGVNVNNFTGNFKLVPIGPAVVQIFLLANSDDGTIQVWFSAPNQPDGTCSPPSTGTGTGT